AVDGRDRIALRSRWRAGRIRSLRGAGGPPPRSLFPLCGRRERKRGAGIPAASVPVAERSGTATGCPGKCVQENACANGPHAFRARAETVGENGGGIRPAAE